MKTLFNLKDFDELFERSIYYSSNEYPVTKMEEIDNNLIIQLALTGYPKENLSIEVQDDMLIIKGEEVTDDKNFFANHTFKRSWRDVYSAWAIKDSEAVYKNGILTITIPKKEESKSSTIKIN